MTPLGIIAGLGDLPRSIAQQAEDIGRGVYVLRLKGFEEPALSAYPGDVVGLGEVGGAMKRLQAAGCKDVTFAGIVKRPNFKDLKLDVTGARLLPKVIREARKGDDALLRVLVSEFEKNGFNVVGAEQVNGGLLAQAGLIAGSPLSEDQWSDLKKGATIAAEMGRLDIGQGCIIANGLVLAVEAQEGTDKMLARCLELPVDIRGTPADRAGVLVKRPKPTQERRIDLPTAGLSTLQGIAQAGLSGLAIEAGAALLLHKDEMIQFAQDNGLFIYGFTEDELN